jgi:gamma-glutamylaminecyclotransferase
METVFVYGSLRQGQGNHRILLGANLVGVGQTVQRFHMRDLGAFPGIVPAPDGGAIVGEVYEVPPTTLARLDRLEGVPAFYRRERVTVDLADGRLVRAWVYVLPPESVADRPTIPGGDWVERGRLPLVSTNAVEGR